MCDTYNGWSNRETWALDSHISNDYNLYTEASARVADAIESDPDEVGLTRGMANRVGNVIREWFDELTDPDEQLMPVEAILTMVRDIGSLYRVNWDEIGKHWHEAWREEH